MNAVKIIYIRCKILCTHKLCKIAGSNHLFKITGMLTSENVKLKGNKIRDITEIDRKKVNVTLTGNKINLPKAVTIKFRE